MDGTFHNLDVWVRFIVRVRALIFFLIRSADLTQMRRYFKKLILLLLLEFHRDQFVLLDVFFRRRRRKTFGDCSHDVCPQGLPCVTEG